MKIQFGPHGRMRPAGRQFDMPGLNHHFFNLMDHLVTRSQLNILKNASSHISHIFVCNPWTDLIYCMLRTPVLDLSRETAFNLLPFDLPCSHRHSRKCTGLFSFKVFLFEFSFFVLLFLSIGTILLFSRINPLLNPWSIL